MKNVSYLTKLRRLLKSVAISFVFLLLGVAGSSFTNNVSGNSGEIKKSGKDSATNQKSSFGGLISSDPTNADNYNDVLFNPEALRYVQTFAEENAIRLNQMKVWGKPYFDIFDGILAQHGLPKQLKYLSVVESSLKSNARSVMGAGGPWQIMPTEAKRLGLRVNSKVDERNNYYKSTHAAARFLNELNNVFHDWLLVIAAYNCGPSRVQSAMRKSGSKDFWKLKRFLPAETRNHVKKFIGTHYVFEKSGGLTTMTAAEIANYQVETEGLASIINLSAEELAQTIAVEISGKYNSAIICSVINIDIRTFDHLNPGFDKIAGRGAKINLRLPVNKMMVFENKRKFILNESVKQLLK